MLFTEPVFLFLFLPLLLLLYFGAPHRARNFLLTLASLLFYAAGEWRFLPWLIASIALNYFVALGLDPRRPTRWRPALLAFGIASDLALLLVFKYSGFFAASLNELLGALHLGTVPIPQLTLPLGISFFTFHKISYKIDIVRGVAEVRRDPLDLLLYILLFPQLIAGPIVRYHDVAVELVRRTVTLEGFAEGVRRFIVGLSKKMLVANTVALVADQIFALRSHQLSVGVAWLGAICYTLQIYFDFSGYSDMAIGLARMFGFHFLENFEYPYISTSITEFWRRWHISLSRWFRDYLYIPLGGNRRSPMRTYFNLGIVFFLCGLWHGASWSFVVWGLFHGGLLIIERAGLSRLLERLPMLVRHGYTMLLVVIGWVVFRADTLPRAGVLLRAAAGLGSAPTGEFTVGRFLTPVLALALAAGIVGSTPLSRWLAELTRRRAQRSMLSLVDVAGVAALAGLLLLSLMQISAGTYNPFIYFRF